MDTRHKKRLKYIQELYADFFSMRDTVSEKTKEVRSHTDAIDEKIKVAAPKYVIDKIAKVDLAILRLAIFELLIEKKEPPKVVINEAIELAHELGSAKSGAFINAVLGNIYEGTP